VAEKAALDHFVAGPENHLVELVVQSVLGDAEPYYSPIILYGRSGTGKSHLALGLATTWKSLFRRRPVVCSPAIDFARDLADAIQTRTVDDFGARYREASLLVIDDLDHLADKAAAQRELIFTLDAHRQSASRVVLTARKPPGRLSGFIPALRSRLVSGLAVPLAPPGRNARLVLFPRLAALRGLRLSEKAVEVLADGVPAPVPGLLGALGELATRHGRSGKLVDAGAARRCVAERASAARPQPSLRDIAILTARHFSLTLKVLRGPSRRQAVVAARAIAMYLARRLTSQNLRQIGRYFGGRDHTTVSYGCQKTEQRLETEPEIRHAVLELQEKLETQ
jgi:chromosomal replication initiator protein